MIEMKLTEIDEFKYNISGNVNVPEYYRCFQKDSMVLQFNMHIYNQHE